MAVGVVAGAPPCASSAACAAGGALAGALATSDEEDDDLLHPAAASAPHARTAAHPFRPERATPAMEKRLSELCCAALGRNRPPAASAAERDHAGHRLC
jgi:hypothetical protein